MSQIQIRISSRFSSQNALLNCHSAGRSSAPWGRTCTRPCCGRGPRRRGDNRRRWQLRSCRVGPPLLERRCDRCWRRRPPSSRPSRARLQCCNSSSSRGFSWWAPNSRRIEQSNFFATLSDVSSANLYTPYLTIMHYIGIELINLCTLQCRN